MSDHEKVAADAQPKRRPVLPRNFVALKGILTASNAPPTCARERWPSRWRTPTSRQSKFFAKAPSHRFRPAWVLRFNALRDVFPRPQTIKDASGHGRAHAERLVHSAEPVEGEIERHALSGSASTERHLPTNGRNSYIASWPARRAPPSDKHPSDGPKRSDN